MSGGVFVSYRRDDAAHVTGRIADALAARIGRERVFVDVDSVAPGEDFVRKIQSTIEASDTFLAVIGANWLNASTPQGQRRIDLPGDFIRLEVSSALAAGIRVIPVLVDGAGMPRAEDLPEDIRQLVRHNAVFISHTTFTRDMQALLDQLALKAAAPQRRVAPMPLLIGAGVMLLAAGAFLLWPKGGGPSGLSATISLTEKEEPDGRRLTHAVFRPERATDGGLSIRSQLPYRDRMRDEKRIDGLSFYGVSPLTSPMPELTVQVTNDTDAPVSINEVQFEVISATPDMSPLPVLRENRIDFQVVRLFNDGWAPLDAARLTIKAWGLPEDDPDRAMRMWKGVESVEPCAEPSGQVTADVTVEGQADAKGMVFDLTGRIPAMFKNDVFVCATGELSYSAGGKTDTLAVRTRVSNRLPDTVVAPPAFMTYDLYLDPDREGYVAVIPVTREIPAKTTDTFSVRIITDKSSDFRLKQTVRTASGQAIPGEAFDLGIFVSRNFHMAYVLNEERRREIPPAALAQADKLGLVARATYDPQGRAPAIFTLRNDIEPHNCQTFLKSVALRIMQAAGATAREIEVNGPTLYGCSTRDAN